MSKRLPQNYIPAHYDLFLYIKEQQESFDASVTITYQKNKDDSKTYLNMHPNIDIKSIIQNNIPLKYDSDYELLTIYRSTTKDQDISSYPITINYSLTPNTGGYIGFYTHDGNYFTKFEPNYAQMLLPCFDDPFVRSTFSVKIKFPSNLTGLSNMPIEAASTVNNETEIQFLKTPPMCTYLLAIFIGDFSSIEGQTKKGLPVKMYSENGRQDLLKEFLKAAIFAVDWMEEKLGVKYELPHLQLVSHPCLNKGMENYGLIALRDYTDGSNFLSSLLTVMHEVAHMWFGDLVSVKWWDSVWLNEGFAQYFMYLILRDFSEEYSNKAIQLYIERDGIRCLDYYDEEIIVPHEDEIDFNERVLKSVIYIKGAFVLKMFSDIVGEVNFLKVCSNWLNEFKNRNGEVSEFITVANKTLNNDYSNFFNTWLKIVGFPLLNVTEICDSNNQAVGLKICQESFTGAIYQFNISIVYEINGEIKNMDVLINEKEKVVEFKYDWALVNDSMNSLCAVNYSKSLVEKLLPAKKDKKISPLNITFIQRSTFLISAIRNVDQDLLDVINELD